MSDWYPSESILPPDDVERSDEGPPQSEPPLREGLPDTYAMRHDRHYVDELLRGRDEPSRDASPHAAPVVSSPTAPHGLTRVLTEVSDGLDAALACWRLSAERPDWSYAATLNRLTQVEIHRVKRLADGLNLLTETPAVSRTQVDVSSLVGQVRESTEPERQLVDVTMTCGAGSPAILGHGDARLLRLALASWFQGMTALVAGSPDPTLHLGVTFEGPSVRLELSTASTVISEPLAARFFDDQYRDRPGGYVAAVTLAVAKRIVEQHDGHATVEPLAPSGCRVTLTIPL